MADFYRSFSIIEYYKYYVNRLITTQFRNFCVLPVVLYGCEALFLALSE